MKIVLCCGGGFSSSAIATRMDKDLKERGLDTIHSIEFLPFTLALKKINEYDIAVLCPHLKIEVDKAKKNYDIKIPLYLLPPKMYGLLKIDDLLMDCEDIIEIYKQSPSVPVCFKGEESLLRIHRGIAHRKFYKL